jgi:hypothetical protein
MAHKTELWIGRERTCGREGRIVTVDPDLGVVESPQICPDCSQLATWDLLRKADVSADTPGGKAKDGKQKKKKDNKEPTGAAKLFGG